MKPSPQGGAGCAPIPQAVVVGIDVGGPRKGFHAVALQDGVYRDQFASQYPLALAAWCIQVGAGAVAIDAPCRWSRTGRPRPAERALAAEGIHAFATPSLEAAECHDFYRWMLNGAALYRVIEAHFRLFDGGNAATAPVCCETFPQAVACALVGRVVPARGKGVVRRAWLREVGIATAPLANIDLVDAALCALAARALLAGRFKTYGEVGEGFIVVPACSPCPRAAAGPVEGAGMGLGWARKSGGRSRSEKIVRRGLAGSTGWRVTDLGRTETDPNLSLLPRAA